MSRVWLWSYLFVSVTFSFAFAQASADPLSAHRPEGQSYQAFISKKPFYQFAPATAHDLRVPVKKLDSSKAAEWKLTREEFLESFANIRDDRFLFEKDRPEFPRRLSWLYPDDGCPYRAEFMARLQDEAKLPAPSKVFAFGNLKVSTTNHPDGYVTWWYHVAISYRYGKTVWVFDPSVEPLRPLSVREWTDRMGGDKASITVSLCDQHALSPYSTCRGGGAPNPSESLKYQQFYLTQEWKRVVDLKESPEKVLGEEPPWNNPTDLLE